MNAIDLVTLSCEHAIEEKTAHLSAIISLINRLTEPHIIPVNIPDNYPPLNVLPEANCQRYEQLLGESL